MSEQKMRDSRVIMAGEYEPEIARIHDRIDMVANMAADAKNEAALAGKGEAAAMRAIIAEQASDPDRRMSRTVPAPDVGALPSGPIASAFWHGAMWATSESRRPEDSVCAMANKYAADVSADEPAPSPDVVEAARGQKVHELKTFPRFWDVVDSGAKTFEFRVTDRDFAVGDVLRLYRSVGADFLSAQYVDRLVTHVLTNADFEAVPPGYAVLSLAAYDAAPAQEPLDRGTLDPTDLLPRAAVLDMLDRYENKATDDAAIHTIRYMRGEVAKMEAAPAPEKFAENAKTSPAPLSASSALAKLVADTNVLRALLRAGKPIADPEGALKAVVEEIADVFGKQPVVTPAPAPSGRDAALEERRRQGEQAHAAEDAECAHMHLDDLKVPRTDPGGKNGYSLVGRIDALRSSPSSPPTVGKEEMVKVLREMNIYGHHPETLARDLCRYFTITRKEG